MRAMIAWWDLNGSEQTIDSLRDFLRDKGVQPWSTVPGLRLKFWIADRVSNRWGAVMLWESAEVPNQPLPPHLAAELIGYPPSLRLSFDIEATIEGIHSLTALAGRGLAFDQHPVASRGHGGHVTEAEVSVNQPGAVSGSFDLARPEFEAPPADPFTLFSHWLDGAMENNISEPTALALATSNRDGHASNRIVRVEKVTNEALVFTTHVDSQKGRDLASTGWASGVLYWRETKQQVIFSGRTERLSDAESDALWAQRPVAAQATSAVSHQSAPLEDEQALRAAAQRLAGTTEPLPRPERWSGYKLIPLTVEFWHGRQDRLHHRLRYDRTDNRWISSRLQP